MMSYCLLIMKRLKNLSLNQSEKYAKLKMKKPRRTELDLRHKSTKSTVKRALGLS